mgnify:CR=1 FL=1
MTKAKANDTVTAPTGDDTVTAALEGVSIAHTVFIGWQVVANIRGDFATVSVPLGFDATEDDLARAIADAHAA